MDAFIFTIALFSSFGIVGFAVLSLFPPKLPILQGVLITPAVGIAATVMPVFFINRLGIPVKEFGGLLSAGLLVLSLITLAIRRPPFPLRRFLPFAGVVLLGLVLSARPMFRFGFDWISFANDDMANYSLAAQRFFENGYFSPLDLDAFFQGRDYSQVYWFTHVLEGGRSGSELLLANIWAATGINPHRAFMPVVLSLHAALILAAGAMVATKRLPRHAALVASALVALSPMTTLGALYQLIAQVGGLTLLCATAVLLYRPLPHLSAIANLRRSIAAVLVLGCLFVYYPEVIPFLGLGWIMFIVFSLLHSGKSAVLRIFLQWLLVGFTLVLVLNFYFFDAVTFLFMQMANNAKAVFDASFPYFLLPIGLPALWGFIPLASLLGEPLSSFAIGIGALVLLVFVFINLKQAKTIPTVALCLSLVILIVGCSLFVRHDGFGLFKLIMFAQPFWMGVIAIAVTRGWRDHANWGKLLVGAPVGCALVAMLVTQAKYVEISNGESRGSFAEIPYASRDGLIRRFADRFAEINHSASVETLGTTHIVLAKLQALYTHGFPVLYTARQFYIELMMEGSIKQAMRQIGGSFPEATSYFNLKDKYVAAYSLATTEGKNKFYAPLGLQQTQKYFDLQPGKMDIFNRFDVAGATGEYFPRITEPNNILEFVHSELGQHYYLGEPDKLAFFTLEQDPLFGGKEFSALGRHIVFRTTSQEVNPRIVMELSSTIMRQFGSALPNALVQGMPVGFVGRGSARVFFPFNNFTYFDGSKYLAIDMARTPSLMLEQYKKGLLGAYGRGIALDKRLLTTFGRDISLISDKAYQALVPPSKISDFPLDLTNKALEYSGIYEDGWLSEQAFFVLSAQPASRYLVIKGGVPQTQDPNFSSTLKVSIGGKEIMQRKIGVGNFEVKVPVRNLQGRQRVDMAFTDYQPLPGGDGRIVGGGVEFIGFTEN
jgi:hypothetical protein